MLEVLKLMASVVFLSNEGQFFFFLRSLLQLLSGRLPSSSVLLHFAKLCLGRYFPFFSVVNPACLGHGMSAPLESMVA